MTNDRFKYRVWDEEDKKYVSEFVFINHHGELCVIEHGRFFRHKCTVEQCTGLKDKNGKLIYENDIVQYNDQECGTVIFREGCWVWDWKVNDPPLYLLESYYFKIVGNIREMESENE